MGGQVKAPVPNEPLAVLDKMKQGRKPVLESMKRNALRFQIGQMEKVWEAESVKEVVAVMPGQDDNDGKIWKPAGAVEVQDDTTADDVIEIRTIGQRLSAFFLIPRPDDMQIWPALVWKSIYGLAAAPSPEFFAIPISEAWYVYSPVRFRLWT